MQRSIEPKLLRGISVYQDLCLPDGTQIPGERDCLGRWEALAPHLPATGTFLDVGSNFGWFGLMLSRTRPNCLVASVEADERTARVQHRLLRSCEATRVCLLTRKAGAAMARRFAQAGQRFDAALCLSVLHWIADHRSFLTELGRISGRLLIEQPAPDENGAGVERIRAEIGRMDRYLADLFPERPIECLAEWPSHRSGPPRQLWLVGEPPHWQSSPVGLEIPALLEMAPGWPNRSWWRQQYQQWLTAQAGSPLPDSQVDRCEMWLTPQGFKSLGPQDAKLLRQLRRRLARLPEHDAMSAGRRFVCHLRRCAAAFRQSWL